MRNRVAQIAFAAFAVVLCSCESTNPTSQNSNSVTGGAQRYVHFGRFGDVPYIIEKYLDTLIDSTGKETYNVCGSYKFQWAAPDVDSTWDVDFSYCTGGNWNDCHLIVIEGDSLVFTHNPFIYFSVLGERNTIYIKRCFDGWGEASPSKWKLAFDTLQYKIALTSPTGVVEGL